MRRRKARGLVTVYRRRGQWILVRSDITSDGMWLSAHAESLGDGPPSAADLGERCRRALESTGRAPRRARGDRSAPTPPEVGVAGARTWRDFALEAEAAQAELAGDTITVASLARRHVHFVEELDGAEPLPADVDAVTLGEHLLRHVAE